MLSVGSVLLQMVCTDSGIYCLLFTLALFINKYVLSVLGFTYPTVYQGWQTLVGAFMLLYLKPIIPKTDGDTYSLNITNFFSLLPILLVYVATLISASKALSAVPIPLFVVAQNVAILCHLLVTIKQLPSYEFLVSVTGLVSSFLLLFYSGSVIDYVDQVWLSGYTIVLILSELFHDSFECQFKEVSKLYYKNAFSFVMLAPFSLYLGEAFTALNFKYLWQFGFYVGCVLSGIFGILLQVYAIKLTKKSVLYVTSAFVKIPAIVLSLVIFGLDNIPLPLWLLIVVNGLSTVIMTYLTTGSKPEERLLDSTDDNSILI